jgi:hypothetical protein
VKKGWHPGECRRCRWLPVQQVTDCSDPQLPERLTQPGRAHIADKFLHPGQFATHTAAQQASIHGNTDEPVQWTHVESHQRAALQVDMSRQLSTQCSSARDSQSEQTGKDPCA